MAPPSQSGLQGASGSLLAPPHLLLHQSGAGAGQIDSRRALVTERTLSLRFSTIPCDRRLNGSDDRLSAGMHIHMLDRDPLLATVAMFIECSHLPRVDLQQLRGVLEVDVPSLERLLGDHCPPKTFHRRFVRRDHLRGEHAL